MTNEQPTYMDLLIESHLYLERQGPGSRDVTIRALSFIESPDQVLRIADMGAGTGGQSMILAEHTQAEIVCIDLIPEFIERLNENADALGLQDRVKGVAGDMRSLEFGSDEFDLIWSEGAIDAIGFEQGLTYWNSLLKSGGYVAVTCPSWLSDERCPEVDEFWLSAGSDLDTIGTNVSILNNSGFSFIAAFVLPEECWTDNYFSPLAEANQALLRKYGDSEIVAAYLKDCESEAELYSRYSRYYGYVFYIGRKVDVD